MSKNGDDDDDDDGRKEDGSRRDGDVKLLFEWKQVDGGRWGWQCYVQVRVLAQPPVMQKRARD